MEIVSDVVVCRTGEKVGGSEATLLAKLGIKPFEYGLVIQQVYDDGSIYDPKVGGNILLMEGLAKDLTEGSLCMVFRGSHPAGIR